MNVKLKFENYGKKNLLLSKNFIERKNRDPLGTIYCGQTKKWDKEEGNGQWKKDRITKKKKKKLVNLKGMNRRTKEKEWNKTYERNGSEKKWGKMINI